MASSELQAKMSKLSRGVEGKASAVQVPRAESPARLNDAYRSGWSRTPTVTPPLGFLPPDSVGSAMSRSGSAPGLARGGEAGSGARSSSSGAVRRRPGAPSVLDRWQPGAAAAAGVESELRRRASLPVGALADAAAKSAVRMMSKEERVAADLALAQRGRPLLAPSGHPGRTCAAQGREDAESTASGSSHAPAQAPSQPAALAAADTDSDAGRSVRSGRSLQTTSTAEPSMEILDSMPGPRLEGWLSKRTSGKISGRWQRRYWVLDGAVLRYCQQPSGPAKKSFDVRRARRIAAVPGLPREFELDFGFRVWRLRADRPEAARQWLLLLEAGQLLAGGAELAPGAEEWSDEETGSEISSVESRASLSPSSQSRSFSSRPTTPVNMHGRGGMRDWQVAPAIIDRLEVNPDELDRRFDAWFPFLADNQPGATDGALVRRGLEQAFRGLWGAFGAPAEAAAGGSKAGPEAALAALGDALSTAPRTLGNAIEGVLAEYLARMQLKLARWLQRGDPAAEDIADVATWLLTEATPSLELFEAGAGQLAEERPTYWRSSWEALESSLLSEWESRRCDEIARQIESVYAAKTGVADAPERAGGGARNLLALGVLKGALQHLALWPAHGAAHARAVSVLIAALNAVLRAHRMSTRHLLPGDGPAAGHGKSGSKGALNRAIRELTKHAGTRSGKEPSRARPATGAELLRAATEAAKFAEFCVEVKTRVNGSTALLSMDVFAAFSGAFEREAAAFCALIVDSSFVESHQKVLKGIKIGHHRGAEQPTGALLEACTAAGRFLEDTFAGAPALCGRLACNVVVRYLVQRWITQFRRSPPSISSSPDLPRMVEADETALSALAGRWGADAGQQGVSAFGAAADPLRPLREVRLLLEDPSPELLAAGAARLELCLGEEQGRALANAVRLAALVI